MPSHLADQLGPDTIFRFVRSAPLRLLEGDLLADAKRFLSAIYFYGYAAEMILKAAYFKNLGFNPLDEIDRDTRNRTMAVAHLNHQMSREPHDFAGWARFLVWDKAILHTPAYESSLRRQILANASTVYENWRPQMRYRHTTADYKIVTNVRKAADWLVTNQHRM